MKHHPIQIILVILFMNLHIRGYSQSDSIAFDRSEDLIESGVKQFDEGNYTSAIQYFSQVSICDPNYARALYEMALCYYNSDNNEEAYRLCKEALSLKYEIVYLYGLIGSILDDMGKSREGITVLTDALKKWPYNQNLIYNLAVCYLNIGEPQKSEELLLKSILLNPYHLKTHLCLAQANYAMGRIAQSYLAYNMVILLNPQVRYIAEYENSLSGKSAIQSKPYNFPYPSDVSHQKWDELKWMIQSELAFKDGFEYDYNVSYTITRQSLMLFRKMKYDPADTSLYNQLYVRLFSEIMQKDEFETYINYVLKNTNDKSVANWNEKNAEKMKEFISSAQDFINTGRDYGFSAQNEAAGKKIYHFNSEGLLESMGEKLIKGTEEIRQGKWLVISKDGSLSEQGSYRNNKTEGDWYVYWPDRKIKQRLFFKNDELEGTLHTYYPTEAVEGIYSFKEGKKNGLQELYTSSGLLVSRSVVRNNSRHGPGIYNSYDEGYTREFNYINDSLSGKKTEKWITGAPKLECYFDGNEYDSIYRSGYPNSKPETEAFYKQGLLSGKWTKYYPSGIKNEAGEYENGNVTGEYYTYDREGNLLTEQGIYSNGVQNGKWIKFPPNGEKRLILTYVDDTITAVECHDNNGNIIYQANEKEGILQYKSFYPDGILEIEGIFMDGKRDGSWKSYNPQGIIKDDFAYLNSQRAGLQKTFYQNGAIKEEYSCDSDMILGIYHEYYSNGQLKSKGFYDKIGRTGDWFTYYKNDSLETHKFFKNDQLTGRFISYSPTGKKLSELFYNDEGKSIRHINYDPDENVSLDMNYEFGAAEFKESFSNGRVKAIVRVSDNQIHGKQEMYYPNGQLAQLDLYEYGMCHGTSKRWDYNGNLTNEITFVLNIPEGEARWYENNLPDFTCHFEYGQYQGKAYSYYSNGKLYREMNFVDDERHGNADYYSPEGNFMYRIRYYNGCIKGYSYQDKNGALISEIPVDTNLAEIICYYPNGKVAMRIPLKKCMYHGKFVSYYPSGNIFRELTYIDDDIEGKVKEFYSNGELRESVTYLHNTQHGPYTLYHQNGKKFKEGNFILGKEDGIWQIYDDADNLREILKYCNGILYESKKL